MREAAGAARNSEGDRDEEDESDFKECGQAYDEADAHHGPGKMFFAEDANEGEGDGVGAAGLGHHFAEHGAEGDDDGDVAEDVADADFEGVDDAGHRHSGDDGESERSEQQTEEWIELEDGDEQDDSDDGAERAEEQEDAVRIDHRLLARRSCGDDCASHWTHSVRARGRKRPARLPVSP